MPYAVQIIKSNFFLIFWFKHLSSAVSYCFWNYRGNFKMTSQDSSILFLNVDFYIRSLYSVALDVIWIFSLLAYLPPYYIYDKKRTCDVTNMLAQLFNKPTPYLLYMQLLHIRLSDPIKKPLNPLIVPKLYITFWQQIFSLLDVTCVEANLLDRSLARRRAIERLNLRRLIIAMLNLLHPGTNYWVSGQYIDQTILRHPS